MTTGRINQVAVHRPCDAVLTAESASATKRKRQNPPGLCCAQRKPQTMAASSTIHNEQDAVRLVVTHYSHSHCPLRVAISSRSRQYPLYAITSISRLNASRYTSLAGQPLAEAIAASARRLSSIAIARLNAIVTQISRLRQTRQRSCLHILFRQKRYVQR